MLIELTYDFLVELHLLITGRFLLALGDEIRRDKGAIYKELVPDLAHVDMLSGVRVYTVESRRFEVFFASDIQQDDDVNDIRRLRVLEINELS